MFPIIFKLLVTYTLLDNIVLFCLILKKSFIRNTSSFETEPIPKGVLFGLIISKLVLAKMLEIDAFPWKNAVFVLIFSLNKTCAVMGCMLPESYWSKRK